MSLPPPLTTSVLPQGWPQPPPAPALSSYPRLTLVTPSYNQAQYIETTLRSVLDQNYPNLEYIVIDGGSKDASANIIRRYQAQLSYWVSEKDGGQADALQKALERATGDWFGWINSDDLLAPGALHAIAAAAQKGDCDIITGATVNFRGDAAIGRVQPRLFSAANFILEHLASGVKWHQPSIWFRREPLAAVGLNRDSHYSFDHELMVRFLHRHPRVCYLDADLAWFRYHEQSKTMSVGPKFRPERIAFFHAIAANPEFAPLLPQIDLATRATEWLEHVDQIMQDRATPRLQRFASIVRGVMQDRRARCTRNTQRAAMRVLKYGGHKQ